MQSEELHPYCQLIQWWPCFDFPNLDPTAAFSAPPSTSRRLAPRFAVLFLGSRSRIADSCTRGGSFLTNILVACL